MFPFNHKSIEITQTNFPVTFLLLLLLSIRDKSEAPESSQFPWPSNPSSSATSVQPAQPVLPNTKLSPDAGSPYCKCHPRSATNRSLVITYFHLSRLLAPTPGITLIHTILLILFFCFPGSLNSKAFLSAPNGNHYSLIPLLSHRLSCPASFSI